MSLDQVAGRLAQSELELVALGYSQEQAEVATRYATHRARGNAAQLPPAQRDAALPALLEEALRLAPAYLDGCARAAAQHEYQREMARAARDGQFERGLRGYGPAKRMDQAWRRGHPQAYENWSRTFQKP